jgi:hypothetical protein
MRLRRIFRSKRVAGVTAVVVAVGAAGLVVALPLAFANAANPNPDTKAVETVNPDGTATVNVSGTWVWPGQNCAGRYGTGWAVDWWGLSSSQLPANNFTLTNASVVTGPGTTTNQSIQAAGSWLIKGTNTYFHVSSLYNGETVNSSSTCTDTGSGSSAGSTGSWSAVATYPSASDVPSSLCAIMYDEHGQEGQPSNSANDFSAVNNNDNSIQTNSFNPQVGQGYCATVTPAPQPKIQLRKQICNVAAANCDKSTNSQWVSSQEIPSGSTAVWRLTITDNGNTDLSNINITDALAPGCAGATTPSTLSPKGTIVFTCSSTDVTKGFTNVAKVTGTPPSGANVSASSSATVTVTTPPSQITTSQSLTPNDEGFVGQEGSGNMTFSLFPPSEPHCKGKPAFTQTVTVSNGIGETTNSSFIATKVGEWRWLVTYSGNNGNLTSPCGSEHFNINNGSSSSSASAKREAPSAPATRVRN